MFIRVINIVDVLPVFGDKSTGYTIVVFREESINETFTTTVLQCSHVPFRTCLRAAEGT